MNYIWEILLRAKAQGLSDNELFFAQAEDCSPWYEQSFPCLNEDTVTGPVVEINSLYRFSEIFQDLLHNMGDSEYLRHLFDAAVHILAAQETLSGLSKRDFYVQMLKRELEGGGFSASIAQALQLLSEVHDVDHDRIVRRRHILFMPDVFVDVVHGDDLALLRGEIL